MHTFRFAGGAEDSTISELGFWLAEEVLLNPFGIVQAEHFDTSRTFGLVTMLELRTGSHLANWFSNSFGDPDAEPDTARQGTTVARTSVLSNDNDIYMPVQNESRVRFADADGIRVALGITDEAMPVDRRSGETEQWDAGDGVHGPGVCTRTRRRACEH